MKARPIVWIALSLVVTVAVGCTSAGTSEKVGGVVEAALQAQLDVLSQEENLQRIERITEAVLQAEATRQLARELAEGAVLGLSEASQEEALRQGVAGIVDALAAALSTGEEGELDPELSVLLSSASTAAARGALAPAVREDLTRLADDLGRAATAAVLAAVAAQLPEILDASAARLSPRVGEAVADELGPALAEVLRDDLAPALAASLEESIGPALEALLAERLLPAVDQAVTERLPPLVRASTREAMLGVGDALDGELGAEIRELIAGLVEDSKGRVKQSVWESPWIALIALVAVLVAIVACVFAWRRGAH
ncbi:MAG: hypothetical protein GY719_00405 [bacterium]|nr:hypothetical protein [bacterium]